MCGIRQRLREEKRKYDEEVGSKALRAAAYHEALLEEKNYDISRGRRKYTSAMAEGGVSEDDGREEPRASYDAETIMSRILQADWNEMKEGLFPAEA